MDFIDRCFHIPKTFPWKHVVSKFVDGKWIVDKYCDNYKEAEIRLLELSDSGILSSSNYRQLTAEEVSLTD